jgi:hypothetical protein
LSEILKKKYLRQNFCFVSFFFLGASLKGANLLLFKKSKKKHCGFSQKNNAFLKLKKSHMPKRKQKTVNKNLISEKKYGETKKKQKKFIIAATNSLTFFC